ncbi:MAG: transcriptional regulator, partial [Rhodothermales bacterium]
MIESPFLISEWHIKPRLNRVIAPAGDTKTLEPRTMKVLVQLARSKPQVVTREQLLDAVWGDSVVTEHSLTIAISDLRKLFNDDPKLPVFIETIRGVGYRLIAPVHFGDSTSVD